MDLQAGLQRLGYQFVPFLVAVVAHEFGHGFIASLWGDKTAQEEGRLTLNPVPHIDPIGTVVFPVIGMVSGINFLFGWAKPVPIDPRRFRKWRQGLFWTSLGGPLANVTCSFLFAFALTLLDRFANAQTPFAKEIAMMLYYGVFINFGLAIFNLIPVPPLDGSKIVESFLPYSMQQKYESLQQYSVIILLALMFTGAISVLSGPIMYMGETTLAIANYFLGAP